MENEEYDKWMEILGEKQHARLTPLTISTGNRRQKKIAYISTISDRSAPLANLIIMLDCSELVTIMEDFAKNSDSAAYVLNSQNTVLLSAREAKFKAELSYDTLSGKRGMQTIRTDRRKEILTFVKSDCVEWYYISIAGYNRFYEKNIMILMLGAFAIFLLLSVGTFVIFSSFQKNYQPISNLLKMVSQKTGLVEKEDELGFLQEHFLKMTSEKEMMETQLLSQKDEFRKNFLRRLLMGKINPTIDLKEAMKRVGLYFPGEWFAVFLIDVKDYRNFFEGINVSEYQKEKSIQMIFSNIVEELLGKNYAGCVVDVDDMMLCAIVNMKKAEEFEEMEPFLRETMQTICRYFDFDFNFALSSLHETPLSLSECYREALEALEYKFVAQPEEKIIFYETVHSEQQSVGEYLYTSDDEYQLSSLARVGNYEKICERLDTIFEKNLGGNYISVTMAKCLLFSLTGMIIKVIGEMKSYTVQEKINVLEVTEKLVACENVWSLKQEIKEVFFSICEITREEREKSGDGLSNQIIRFVSEHYQDGNLNIAMIAEVLDLSAAYIGTVFRQQTGQSLLGYINQYRIDIAKKLLSETNYTVKRIAIEVGYVNTNVFMRIFKRQTGLTASEYRESFREKQ